MVKGNMNKGICFHFGYVYKDIEQQVKDIKESGLNCVICTADPAFDKDNWTIKKQVKLFQKYNLKLSSLHMRYKRDELENFWLNNRIGKRVMKNLIKDIKAAYKYGFKCVVVHVVGNISEIGKERLSKVLFYCEKLNIPLALENLNKNNQLLDDIYSSINSEYLKFCYDAGHAHCFEPEIDHLTKYKDKVIALHLHDNLGDCISNEQYERIGYMGKNSDMHTLNKYGNINWEEIAKKLAKVPNELNLDYEVMMTYRQNETPKDVLKEVYNQACELETLINKCKKQK